MKTITLFILLAIFTYSCTGNNTSDEMMKTKGERMKPLKRLPFEIKLYDHNYSLAYSLQYILNEESLEIFRLGGLEGEKGEFIYKKSLSNDEKNKTGSFIEGFSMDSLQTNYVNRCIQDGNQKTLLVKIGDKQKQIHVSNYYRKDVGELIELLNSNIPKEFEINYDKEELQKLMKDCNK
jgi:hypothetical protein